MSVLRTRDQLGVRLMKQGWIWRCWKRNHIIQNPNGNKTAVECGKDWPALVRSLEVFRQNRQLPSWSVKTEGTILAGNLVLPSSGKWSTYSYRMDENHDQAYDESFWHVEIKQAERLQKLKENGMPDQDSQDAWETILPLLDDAVDTLREDDR